MLVVFDLALFLFLVEVLHALLVLFLERVHALEHGQDAVTALSAVKKRLEPGLGFAAVADQQIAALDAQEILRRRLVAVRLRAGRDEQHELAAL